MAINYQDCWTYPKEKIDELIMKSITERKGKVTGKTGATLSEYRVVQKGRVVECHFVCTLSAAVGSSEKKIADISGVDLPPTKIRFTCSTGAAAYNAKNACYGIVAQDGEISVLAGTTTDTIIVIDLVYTVD